MLKLPKNSYIKIKALTTKHEGVVAVCPHFYHHVSAKTSLSTSMILLLSYLVQGGHSMTVIHKFRLAGKQTHTDTDTHTCTCTRARAHTHTHTHTHTHARMHTHTPTHVYTRDAMIHILDVLIYHLFCIMIQRYIAQYEIAEFCRQIGPFFQKHNVLYLLKRYRTKASIQLQHQS